MMNIIRGLVGNHPGQSLPDEPLISAELQTDIDGARAYLDEESSILQQWISDVNAPERPLSVEQVLPIELARGELQQMIDALEGANPDLFLIETLNRAREAAAEKSFRGINREDTARKAGVIVMARRISLALQEATDSDGAAIFSKPKIGIDGQSVVQTIAPKPFEQGTDVYLIETLTAKNGKQEKTEHILRLDLAEDPVTASIAKLTNPDNKARPNYKQLDTLAQVWRANNSLIVPDLPKY